MQWTVGGGQWAVGGAKPQAVFYKFIVKIVFTNNFDRGVVKTGYLARLTTEKTHPLELVSRW